MTIRPDAREAGTRSRRGTTKVLVQVNSLGLGGTQINAVDLAWAVRPLGFECVLVGPRDTLPPGPSLFDVAAERGVELQAFDRRATTLRGARDLAAMARDHGSDLVHTYGSWSSRSAYWGPCFAGRRPLVMTVYEMAVTADTFRAPDLIIGTRYLLEDLSDRAGRTHLISPPVDLVSDDSRAVDPTEFLAAEDLAPDHLRIVMVTRLDDDMKALGVELSIRALDDLARDDVDLVIVGSGSDEGRLRALGEQVNQRRGRRVITFTGAMSDPRPAYACADIVIGMGGSAARALAFGKPLIAAGEAGWFRLFSPESAAALFRDSFWSDLTSPDPIADLREILAATLGDRARRHELGTFGRDFAEANFGLEAMADALAAVYDVALAKYRPADWLVDSRLEAVALRRRLGRRTRALLPRGTRSTTESGRTR